MTERILTIIGTKDEPTGTTKDDFLGEHEILSKDQLVKRIKELTDDNVGYTILIAEK